jgi:putative transposase
MVVLASPELPVRQQCELLSVNRSSLYYQPRPTKPQAVELAAQISTIYQAHPYYGRRRITAVLRRQGRKVNPKQVRRLMRRLGLAGIRPKPNLSKRNQTQAISPYLLTGVKASHPNHVWGIDITYIRLHRRGWLYLVAVIDWYSRYVISWQLDQTLAMPFVLQTVQQALLQARPEIWNSDQGSHFTSQSYRQLLAEVKVQISMDGRGRAIDNVFTERLWWSIKYEEVYLNDYQSPAEARRRLSAYLRYYNQERPHQALDYRTPAEVYWGEPKQGQVTNNQKGDEPILQADSIWSKQWVPPHFLTIFRG